jgi:hypothetical protein
MPLTLAVARETADGENRTALVPETAKKFAALGATCAWSRAPASAVTFSTPITAASTSSTAEPKPTPVPRSSCA